MWAELKSMRDGGWDLTAVIPDFGTEGESRKGWAWAGHGAVSAAAPPPHGPGLTYADLPSALHIFARWDEGAKRPKGAATNGDDAELNDVDVAELEGRLAMPLGDRMVLREHVGDLLYACNASKEAVALQLRALPCRDAGDVPPLV
eukprot:gene43602-26133_t